MASSSTKITSESVAKITSETMLKTWDKGGQNDFILKVKLRSAQHHNSVLINEDGTLPDFIKDMYDLLSYTLKGLIKKESFVRALESITPLHTDMICIILDMFNLFDIDVSLLDQNSKEKAILSYIVKASESFVTEKLMKERLEIDSLQEMKILNNRNFYSKFIKVKTKLYYKQRKFNLFREESEGFSKLITDISRDQSNGETPEKSLENVKSLIGCFNLDPNRVLDVILELFEQHTDQYSFYIPLIKSYMPDPKILCEVLGFKFSCYHNTYEPTRISLFILTATMLQHDIIRLDDIYIWLIPHDTIIVKDFEKELSDAKEYVRKLHLVSTKDKEDKDKEEIKKDEQSKYELNQKFGLAEALLRIGDWDNFVILKEKFPDFCLVDQPPIGLALCNLISRTIEPVYRKNSGLGPKVKGIVIPPFQCSLTPKPCEELLDLREVVLPMIYALGPSLHLDVVLTHKIIRMCDSVLKKCDADPNKPPPTEDTLYYDVISIFDLVILPTLSHIEANCCINEDIWNVIKRLPYSSRYFLYGSWKNNTYQNHAKLIRRRGDAEKKSKAIMKQVTKENVKPAGRHMGKLSHYAPGCLFDEILSQIQRYDNLIAPIVDSLKYLTALAYDVLTYCIIEKLAVSVKDRFKTDSTSISAWLQSIAQFCGHLFKKYNMELTGILQYIANQLKQQRSLDLCILKEIVQKMGGIEIVDDITEDQLEAMCGGEALRNEAGYFLQVRNTKRSSSRLKESLCNDNLAVALCLLIAQQKNCVIYSETSHMKLIGTLYDQCQDTLVQFGTFLGSTMSMDEYVARLPSIQTLLLQYHINIDIAFFIARPMFNHTISSKYDNLRKSDPNSKKDPSIKLEKYIEAVNEVMGPVIKSVIPLHTPKVWEDISPEFLVTFWSLQTSDIFVPVEAYNREVAKLKMTSLNTIDSKQLGALKIKKEAEKFSAMMEKLNDEKKKQQEHVERVMGRLNLEKDIWFVSRSPKGAKNESINQFLQLCIFPRCIFTSVDAVFCAKFIHLLHKIKAANFSSLLCYDRLFCDITYVVTLCTENEAHRYGRFLACLLETVMRWHSDKKIYEAECADNPGFITKCRVSSKELMDPNQSVGYENFRHACHKWHYKITKSIMLCLESKDYVQIRNAFIILLKILPSFPVLSKLSLFIEKTVNKVRDEEKNNRQDLFTIATGYLRYLISKTPNLMKESDFHDVSDKVKKQAVPPKAAAATTEESKKSVNGVDTSTVSTKSNATTPVNGNIQNQTKEESSSNVTTSSIAKEKSDRRILNRNTIEIKNEPVSTKKETVSSTPASKELKKKTKSKDDQQPPEKRHKEKKEREDRKDVGANKDESHSSSKRSRTTKSPHGSPYYAQQSPSYVIDDHRSTSPQTPRSYVTVLSPASPVYDYESPSYVPSKSPSYYPNDQYPTRDLSSISNSSSGSLIRHASPQERTVRESKRRRTDGTSTSKNTKHSGAERESLRGTTTTTSGGDKKEKREKRDKKSGYNEKSTIVIDGGKDKDSLRKKKMTRKRDRQDEVLTLSEQKKRKEDKPSKSSKSHSNGDQIEHRETRAEKHHYTREKSTDERFSYERENRHEHERVDKHTRRTGDKRR